MLLVLPTTSNIRRASYLTPHPYEYHPGQYYHPHYDVPRSVVPSYSSHFDLPYQPSAEELEEYEYRQALEVVANHRRRQAVKETAARRQQLACAYRQRYLAALEAELERDRREELFVARRAELIRSQQARARLAAAERQHAFNTYLGQLKGPQPVCSLCGCTECSILICLPPRSPASHRFQSLNPSLTH